MIVKTMLEGERTMPEDAGEKKETIYNAQDHPWLEMHLDASMPEEIRCSLDDIRVR